MYVLNYKRSEIHVLLILAKKIEKVRFFPIFKISFLHKDESDQTQKCTTSSPSYSQYMLKISYASDK